MYIRVLKRFSMTIERTHKHRSKRKKEGIKREDDEEEKKGGMIVQYRVYAEGGMYVCIVPCRKNE